MHDIDLKTQMDIVYHSLNDTSKGIMMLLAVGHSRGKVQRRQGI